MIALLFPKKLKIILLLRKQEVGDTTLMIAFIARTVLLRIYALTQTVNTKNVLHVVGAIDNVVIIKNKLAINFLKLHMYAMVVLIEIIVL